MEKIAVKPPHFGLQSEIDIILDEVDKCTTCPNLSPWKKFPKDVHGNMTAPAMVVSEAPGRKSLDSGGFWRGSSGKRLRNILAKTGLTLEELFYLTDTVKCGPPNNRTPMATEISNCKGFLDREILTLNPKYILAFGETAIRYFLEHYTPNTKFTFSSMLEIQNCKGFKVIEFSDFHLIPFVHPSRANVSKRDGELCMDYNIYRKQLSEVYGLVISECALKLQGQNSGADQSVKGGSVV